MGKLQEAKLIYISRDMEIPQGGKDKRRGGIWKKREREKERARRGGTGRGGEGWRRSLARQREWWMRKKGSKAGSLGGMNTIKKRRMGVQIAVM